MNDIEIFIHIEGEAEPRLLKTIENALVEDVLREITQGRHEDHVLIFEDIVLEPAQPLHHHGVKHHHHVHCRRKVEIKVDGKDCWTHRGRNSVEHIRKIGKPKHEILSEYINGEWVDLDDHAHVEICGGEKFASHPKSGGSS